MKSMIGKIKMVVFGTIILLSSMYGVAQAWNLTNVAAPGCISCSGCGPYGGIAPSFGGNLCIVCCVPPSE
mgnify:CR=1 FL=1